MKKSILFVVAIVCATSAFTQDTIYKVGDISAELGGIIFYVDLTGQHGLVCPNIDQGEYEWGCRDIKISGANGQGVYNGKQNTIAILANCGQPSIAAAVCDNLALYEKDDWYLPSKVELNLMYENLHLKGIGHFENVYYLSSTENDGGAWRQDFVSGEQNYGSKDYAYRVRAVRAF